MNNKKVTRKSTGAFTLLEMLGVVAIIGVLISIISVAVVQAVHSAELKAVLAVARNAEAAVLDFTKAPGGPGYPPITESTNAGAFAVGTNTTGCSADVLSKATTLDNILLSAGYMKKPINLSLVPNPLPGGTTPVTWDASTNTLTAAAAPDADFSSRPRLVCKLSDSGVPATGNNYRLNSVDSIETGSRLVSLVVPGCQIKDAAKLANMAANIKDKSAGAASITAAWSTGMVVYGAPDAAGLTTVYVYVGEY